MSTIEEEKLNKVINKEVTVMDKSETKRIYNKLYCIANADKKKAYNKKYYNRIKSDPVRLEARREYQRNYKRNKDAKIAELGEKRWEAERQRKMLLKKEWFASHIFKHVKHTLSTTDFWL